MQRFQVRMVLRKETPGTHVYTEPVHDDGSPPKLRTLYLPKWVLGTTPPPAVLVTVEEAKA